jgi:hypothetical protein
MIFDRMKAGDHKRWSWRRLGKFVMNDVQLACIRDEIISELYHCTCLWLVLWWYFNPSNLSLRTPPMSSLVYPHLSLHYQHALAVRYALVHLEACAKYAQTILNDVGQASLQSLLPQLYLEYHHSRLGPSLCGHTSISTCASLPHLTVEHVAF